MKSTHVELTQILCDCLNFIRMESSSPSGRQKSDVSADSGNSSSCCRSPSPESQSPKRYNTKTITTGGASPMEENAPSRKRKRSPSPKLSVEMQKIDGFA